MPVTFNLKIEIVRSKGVKMQNEKAIQFFDSREKAIEAIGNGADQRGRSWTFLLGFLEKGKKDQVFRFSDVKTHMKLNMGKDGNENYPYSWSSAKTTLDKAVKAKIIREITRSDTKPSLKLYQLNQ